MSDLVDGFRSTHCLCLKTHQTPSFINYVLYTVRVKVKSNFGSLILLEIRTSRKEVITHKTNRICFRC